MDLTKLASQLDHEEGHVNKLYRDTQGHLTGGVGHNFDNPLPEDVIQLLLQHDMNGAVRDLDANIPWWRDLSETRQLVLADMCFNLGINKLLEFKHMLAAAEAKDFEKASKEMLNSDWAKQVKSRATNLAQQMKEG